MINAAKLRRVAAIIVLAGASLTLGACATAALPSQMSVRPGDLAALDAGAPGYHRLRVVQIQGGSATNPLWLSNVSNDDFRAALVSSLAVMGYLADDPAKADLELTASIVDLERPVVAIQPTVVSKVRYTVSPAGGGAPLFDETLAASGTPTMAESFFEPDPTRPANEAAMRANISIFLQELQRTLKAKVAVKGGCRPS